MNTPAHMAINLVLLGRKDRPELNLPILFGALMPDVPMLVFYLDAKLLRDLPETVIWADAYYHPGWLAVFDGFNSIPLALGGWLLATIGKHSRWAVFFASMALHGVGDFLLHHDDAHRHFAPLSNWRFESPVSYWDPDHLGHVMGLIEIAAVVGACVFLWRRFSSSGARRIIVGLAAVYTVYWGYAVAVWM